MSSTNSSKVLGMRIFNLSFYGSMLTSFAGVLMSSFASAVLPNDYQIFGFWFGVALGCCGIPAKLLHMWKQSKRIEKMEDKLMPPKLPPIPPLPPVPPGGAAIYFGPGSNNNQTHGNKIVGYATGIADFGKNNQHIDNDIQGPKE